MVSEFNTYVDYYRGAAWSAEEALRSAQRVGSICQYLGLQYAPQKSRMDGKDRVLWIGKKVHIIYGFIY